MIVRADGIIGKEPLCIQCSKILHPYISVRGIFPAGQQIEMLVNAVDYLRILASGNFMSFVALVLYKAPDPKDNLSVVATESLRLKVWNSATIQLIM